MEQLRLKPIEHFSGTVNLPGSKSLSNRALLLAALAHGETKLENLLLSEDTEQMLNALTQFGIAIEFIDISSGKKSDRPTTTCVVSGNGGLFVPPNESHFSLGNAGTAIRPLTSILSLSQGTFTVDGDQYMRERPIAHLAEALVQLGAKISYLGKAGCPPIKIEGGKITGGKVNIKGDISSQYLTSLLMALPLAPRDSVISIIGEQVSKPYLDITLDIMEKFGVYATHDNYQHFMLSGAQQYQSPGTYLIEGDASSASYFYAAGAIGGGPVTVTGLGSKSVQGDIAFLDVIEAMGAIVDKTDHAVTVTGGTLKGVDMDLNHIPDAAMTIAAMALFADGPTRIRNIYNWRVKETDRLHAMSTELRKLGALVETGEDFIYIEPPKQILPATIDTYGDHRIAMCFSLAAFGQNEILINDPACVAKTFPTYFELFSELCVSTG
jgi:3-phosphoshikimate 1-carboxyvinyltransferase